MAGFKGAAVLLKGLTEHKPFHRMDETSEASLSCFLGLTSNKPYEKITAHFKIIYISSVLWMHRN